MPARCKAAAPGSAGAALAPSTTGPSVALDWLRFPCMIDFGDGIHLDRECDLG
jgi:hypothetical protein